MVERTVQSKKRYILAFLIATFIFINIFFFTYLISYFEYQRVSNQQEQLSYEIFEDKLYYESFDKGGCSLSSLDKISADLRYQGSIIDLLEKKLGKNNEDVLNRKKFYTLIELEHLEFIENMKQRCGYNLSIILFFYSNDNQYIKQSEDLGKLLDSVYERNNVLIYSFDINLDSLLIQELKKKYSIDAPLTLIINGNTKLVAPKTINEIEKYIV